MRAWDTRAKGNGRGTKTGHPGQTQCPQASRTGEKQPSWRSDCGTKALKRRGITESSPARRLSPSRRPYPAPGRPRTPEGALPDRRRRPAAWTPRPAAVGLRTAPPPPPGSKRPGGRRVGRLSLRPLRQRQNGWPPLPPSSQGPRTLTPPTRSHTIPEASGARALCRSGAASRPRPEMAAEQRESGLGRAPVRLAGRRGPPRERSAAVA